MRVRLLLLVMGSCLAVAAIAAAAPSRFAAEPPVTVTASSVESATGHRSDVSGTIHTYPAEPNASYTAVIEGPGVDHLENHGTLDAKGDGTFDFSLSRPPAKNGTFKVTITVGKAPRTVTGSTTVQVRFRPPVQYVVMQGKYIGFILGADTDGTVHADDNPGDDTTGKIVTGDDGVTRFEGTTSHETLKNGAPAQFNVKVLKEDNVTTAVRALSVLITNEITTRSYLRAKPAEGVNPLYHVLEGWYLFSHSNISVEPSKQQIEALVSAGKMTKADGDTFSEALDKIRDADKQIFEDLRVIQRGYREHAGDPNKHRLSVDEKKALADDVKKKLTATIALKQEVLRAVISANGAERCPEALGAGCPVTIGTAGTWTHNVAIGKTRVCVDVTTKPKQAFISGTVSGPSGTAELARTALGQDGSIQVRVIIGLPGNYTWTLVVYDATGSQTGTATVVVPVADPPTNGPATTPPCDAPTG